MAAHLRDMSCARNARKAYPSVPHRWTASKSELQGPGQKELDVTGVVDAESSKLGSLLPSLYRFSRKIIEENWKDSRRRPFFAQATAVTKLRMVVWTTLHNHSAEICREGRSLVARFSHGKI